VAAGGLSGPLVASSGGGRPLTPPAHCPLCFQTMFTLTDHPDPDRGSPFPESRIVENRARLEIWHLQRAGALTAGAETAISVRGIPVGYLRALRPGSISIELAGLKREILLLEDEPMPDVRRAWLECLACRKRCRHLYLPELQCRACLGLEHRCRHRMLWGNTARVSWLRRLLGADERPFAPLPVPKRRSPRYWRLADRIAREEEKLLASVRRLAEAAEREGKPE
jgi:hypothetical protein